jgi:long-chain fatty acid transport protein
VQPINATWTFGLGVNTPFGLTTEWDDDFRGRFISRLASLTAIDVNPTLGWQVSPNLGIGFGIIGRFSSVELEQHAAAFNFFTQTVDDVGTVKLDGSLDNDGYGWNIGILNKVNNSFSWGFSYRSQITVDYKGDATVTQNLTGTPFDSVVQGVLPFGQTFPVETSIDFPDMASFGVALALGPNSLLEADFNWTGWSSFEALPITFPGGELPSSEVPERYDDAYNYRLGLSWNSAPNKQWRFGVVYDETPQPEESVSPLLPDSDRVGVTIGYGYEGAKVSYDWAVMYLDFDKRTRDSNFSDEPDSTFFGSYKQEAVLIGLTLGF